MKKLTLTSKLVLGGMLIMLIPVLIIGTLTILKSSTAMESLFKDQVVVTADSLSHMVQLTLGEEMNMAKEIAVGPNAVDTTTKVAREGAENSVTQIEGLTRKLAGAQTHVGQNYEAIIVIGPDGKIFADSQNGKYKGIDVSEREYFKSALEGKYNAGAAVLSKATGDPIVPIAAPIFSEKKEVVGVLALLLKTDYLVDKVLQTKLGRSGYAYVLSRDGLFLAHPDKSLILKTDIKTMKGMEQISKLMLSGTAGVGMYTYEGVEKLAGYSPVQLTGWTVVVGESYSEIMSPIHAVRWQVIWIGAILLAIITGVVLFFGRRISMPISRAVQGLSKASDQIVSASFQISTASQQLAEGTSEQAAAIEETSASLEEMSSMTRQNADNAGQANQIMAGANQIVGQANHSMNLLTTSMGEISKASEETQKIIKTIDEIAFQTNLLALNAAVEAARAGEAGAGFAVVADEVRNLALRAAEAAKNTANLIEGTVKSVRDGSELLQKTNKEFDGVATSVSKSSELVAEIAAASQEQAQGIHQISRAVTEMDKVVQRNASSAEESAASSEEMNAQAEQMRDFIAGLAKLVRGNEECSISAENSVPVLRTKEPIRKVTQGRQTQRAIAHSSKRDRGGNGTKLTVSKNGVREMSPEEVIPLENESFEDF